VAAVDADGLAFTPLANKSYEFFARLLLRTAVAGTGPRPGVAWPTAQDGVVDIRMPTNMATAEIIQFGNIAAPVLLPSSGLLNATQSWIALIVGVVVAGPTPSGTLRIQLASETAGTSVTIKAGSFLSWREVS
jgi:hypothetical protein